jgi:orotidine-5'-phosphate decarboxylase
MSLVILGEQTIMHFADRLLEACHRKGNALCVGIDPRWDVLPAEIRNRHNAGTLDAMATAFEEFSLRVLEIVAPLVPVVKPQSAFFEACGPVGMLAQQRVLAQAKTFGLLTILDNKRGDIASTAEAYADAALAGTPFEGARHPVWAADALTVNPYLGRDAVEPFLASARRCEAGVFVLVRTSNKGAKQFQDLQCDGKPVYQHVAEAVGAWSAENVGASGLGDVGAVVGATHPAELALVRRWIPHVIFLVPGYGAQGGSAADTAAAFRADGSGAIVNSSRGITACFKPDEPKWQTAIERATKAAIQDLLQATPMSALSRR